MEREITILGNTAICHAWEYDPKETKVDHSESVNLIRKLIEARSVAGKSKLVAIEGITGSGKTILAKILSQTGENTVYIDVVNEHARNDYKQPDIAPLLTDKDVTYIIDEGGLCKKDSFQSSLKLHLDNGGVAVVLVQSKRSLDVLCKDCWLTLSRDGLAKT